MANRVEIASSFSARLRGLIGREGLDEGEGLLLKECSTIHTFFMKFPIDAVYLSGKNTVVAVETNLKPWRFGGIHGGAKHVLELRSHAAGCVRQGNTLDFFEEEGGV